MNSVGEGSFRSSLAWVFRSISARTVTIPVDKSAQFSLTLVVCRKQVQSDRYQVLSDFSMLLFSMKHNNFSKTQLYHEIFRFTSYMSIYNLIYCNKMLTRILHSLKYSQCFYCLKVIRYFQQ